VTLILAAGLDWVTEAESWVAFATLLAMEIVLGIDNVVFISILAKNLKSHLFIRRMLSANRIDNCRRRKLLNGLRLDIWP
jgi:hypothetical protein